ncbi:MAG: hypothetical protein V9G14_00740 [Cypionkella sp.]
MVDENMANAARVHAVENGKDISDNLDDRLWRRRRRCMRRGCARSWAFDQCLIPPGAGVGSAIGFLQGTLRL